MKIATRLRVFVAKFILYFGNPWLGRRMAVRGGGGGSFAERGFLDDDAGFHLFALASRTCSAVGGCGLCGLGVWHLAPFGQQPATRIWGIQPRRFVRFLLVVLINTRTEPPSPPGWSRGVNDTWSPPSSFCQRSDTRRRSHGTDDGAKSGGMRGNTAMAMRLCCCCRDVQAPDRRGCARKKKGRNAAPNLHDFVKGDPRSRALDWPSGRETTLDQDSLRTQWLSHLFQLLHLSLLITSQLSANTLVPQKDQWGQRVGGVVGKPEAHGGRVRVGGQCLGHRLDRAGHARTPRDRAWEPVSCGASIATNCRAGSPYLAAPTGGVL